MNHRETVNHFALLSCFCLIAFVPLVAVADDGSQDGDQDPAGRDSGTLLIEWINDYPGDNDLEHCDEDARGLEDQLAAEGWDSTECGDDAAWEEDFKIESRGGNEKNYADHHDLSYFSGYGSKQDDRRTLYFSTNHDDKHLRPADCEEGWGDNLMEWIAFNAGKVMIDRSYWASCMYGLHLILGWESTCYDVDMGTPFGAYLVEDDDEDDPLKLKQAWFQAADDTNPSDLKVIVAGENSDMGNDYIHGQGDGAADDPSPDDRYVWWGHTTSKKDASRSPASAPREGLAFEVLPAQGPRGYTVTYHADAGRDLPTVLNRFEVLPVEVDESYVGSVADAIRNVLGTDRMDASGTPVGQDGMGNYVMSEEGGDDYLLVSPPTGAATLIDTELWLSTPETPPTLPSELEAISQAEALLTALGRIPTSGTYSTAVRRFTAETVDKSTGAPQSSTDYNVQVMFQRKLDGYPVTGPGGTISVDLGNEGYVQRWSEAGWRTVAPGVSQALVPWETVLVELTTHGAAATIDGITIYANTIQVDNVSVGYYEHNRWTDQTYIEPIYIVDTTLNPGTAQEDSFTLHMEALRLPLTATILAPLDDGLWFAEGTPISFDASAANGTPTYGYDWSSNIDGFLGTGMSISWADLSVAQKGWTAVKHTITVEVTDSAEASTSRSISVGICPETWYPDQDGDGYGDTSDPRTDCPPLGRRAIGGDDCNDANGDTYPGAEEINDGLDNQCLGDEGFGLIDELPGMCGFHNPVDKNELSWTAQGGATSYEVARSADPQFLSGCTITPTSSTSWSDGDPVASGVCHHYLVRAAIPNVGSWGWNSGGERTGICP